MKSTVAALGFACLFAGHAWADEAPCEDLAASRVKAQSIADQTGAGLVNLDGAKAQAMLDEINKSPPSTDFKAEHLSVLMFVRGGFALVAIADSECGGYKTGIKVPLDLALKAYRAAAGIGI